MNRNNFYKGKISINAIFFGKIYVSGSYIIKIDIYTVKYC